MRYAMTSPSHMSLNDYKPINLNFQDGVPNTTGYFITHYHYELQRLVMSFFSLLRSTWLVSRQIKQVTEGRPISF